VLVAAGRFGVIYAYVVKVAAMPYRLSEWAVSQPKQTVFDLLQAGIDDGTLLTPLLNAGAPPDASLAGRYDVAFALCRNRLQFARPGRYVDQ
jgi:hypothetical protein